MSAHPATQLLSAYLDQELRARERQAVAVHVEDCDGCRHRLDGLRRVIGELRSITPAHPPELLTRRVEGHVTRALRERRIESVLSRGLVELRPQSALRLGFALVMSLALMILIFAQGLSWRDESRTALIVPPDSSLAHRAEGQRIETGGRIFSYLEGRWVEAGLDPAAVRLLVASSVEARALLGDQEWLSELVAQGHGVILEWEGEVLELVPLPHLRKTQGGES